MVDRAEPVAENGMTADRASPDDEATRGGVEATLRDVVYTAVGAGIMSFQRAQVFRRRIEGVLGLDQRTAQPDETMTATAVRAASGDGWAYLRLAEQMAATVDRTVDAVLDVVQERLPDAPSAALARSRDATKEVRRQTAALLGCGGGRGDDSGAPAEA